MKYFIHNGQKLEGPYNKEQLKELTINPHFSIWFEGPAGLETLEQTSELLGLKNKYALNWQQSPYILPIAGAEAAWKNSSQPALPQAAAEVFSLRGVMQKFFGKQPYRPKHRLQIPV